MRCDAFGFCSPLFGERQLQAALQQLRASSLLGRHPRDPPSCEALHYIGRAVNPAADVSLRTIDPERFVIYNAADACVLEEVEANMAFYEIYDGAIYLYQVTMETTGLFSGYTHPGYVAGPTSVIPAVDRQEPQKKQCTSFIN
jgi:hypothetical protein